MTTLTEITPEEFRNYADKSPYKSFMQTPEIAEYRKKNGWTPHFLALKENSKIKAATLLVSKPTFLGKSTFIAPGGPLLDFEDTKTAKIFLEATKAYAKSHNGFTLQISPYYELIERDREGNKVPGGFYRKKALKTLESLKFKPTAHPSQPKYLFALDINQKSPDTLLAEFKRNTRNHIRKAEKMGVRIRELKREELPILKQITESTSRRRHFTDRPLSYYEAMYDLFSPRQEVKFIIAKADIKEPEVAISKHCAPSTLRNGTSGSLKPISTAMFMLYGDEIVYLFSGSDEQYMKDYNAQYLIQWHMIKYAADHGFKRYNFYGIHGLPSEGQKDGIYDFKKGFTTDESGHVIELIGTFETSLNPLIARLYHFLQKLRH